MQHSADTRVQTVAAAEPRRVALLVETSLSSGNDILRGIAEYMREHGPWQVYAHPHDLHRPPPAWFRNWQGDGIIARLQDRRTARLVAGKKAPVVDVLGVVRFSRIPLVHVDNRAIAAMAAEHLLDRGFQHFAFAGLTGEYWAEERRTGFRDYLGSGAASYAELLFTRRQMETTPWEKLVARAARWAGTLPRPAGILLSSDVEGLVISEGCAAAGLRIGDQAALVGVGNDRTLCALSNPPLSSVEANHFDVGYRAAELLDRMMAGGRPPAQPMLVPPLHVGIRESTDFLAVPDEAVQKALRHIGHHFAGHLDVDDVARASGVSRSVLQRRFRHYLHRTVHDEIRRARLDTASRLLRTTRLPLDDIAERTGFGYATHLSRAFRRYRGCRPGDLRRRDPRPASP